MISYVYKDGWMEETILWCVCVLTFIERRPDVLSALWRTGVPRGQTVPAHQGQDPCLLCSLINMTVKVRFGLLGLHSV